MDFGGDSLVALSKLLTDCPSGEDDNEILKPSDRICTPATIIGNSLPPVETFDKPIGAIEIDPKAIWDDDEVPVGRLEDPSIEDVDTRKRPSYEILYRQDVMAEDVFFGTEKDPSSTSCNVLTVKINFPGHSLADLELDVSEQRLVAESKTHKLSMYLPYPVHYKDGKASWNKDHETLIVRLPLNKKSLLD